MGQVFGLAKEFIAMPPIDIELGAKGKARNIVISESLFLRN
jgi:hypothetical protein